MANVPVPAQSYPTRRTATPRVAMPVPYMAHARGSLARRAPTYICATLSGLAIPAYLESSVTVQTAVHNGTLLEDMALLDGLFSRIRRSLWLCAVYLWACTLTCTGQQCGEAQLFTAVWAAARTEEHALSAAVGPAASGFGGDHNGAETDVIYQYSKPNLFI